MNEIKYYLSEATGKLYDENFVEVLLGDEFISWQNYVSWLSNGNTPDSFPGTEKELEEINFKKYYQQIYVVEAGLRLSALRRCLGKTNKKYSDLTESDLMELEKKYIFKNEIAIKFILEDIVLDQDMFDLMNNVECEIDFADDELVQTVNYLNYYFNTNIPTENITRIKQYCFVVSAKYNIGVSIKNLLFKFLEIFRSLSITRLETKEYSKLEAGFDLVKTINNNTTIEEIVQMKNTFYNL